MTTPAEERALRNVVEWAAGQEDWGDFRSLVFGAHFGPLMDGLELPDEALFERLGPLTPVVLTAVRKRRPKDMERGHVVLPAHQ